MFWNKNIISERMAFVHTSQRPFGMPTFASVLASRRLSIQVCNSRTFEQAAMHASTCCGTFLNRLRSRRWSVDRKPSSMPFSILFDTFPFNRFKQGLAYLRVLLPFLSQNPTWLAGERTDDRSTNCEKPRRLDPVHSIKWDNSPRTPSAVGKQRLNRFSSIRIRRVNHDWA